MNPARLLALHAVVTQARQSLREAVESAKLLAAEAEQSGTDDTLYRCRQTLSNLQDVRVSLAGALNWLAAEIAAARGTTTENDTRKA